MKRVGFLVLVAAVACLAGAAIAQSAPSAGELKFEIDALDRSAGYVRPDPPVSRTPWHICATAWEPRIFSLARLRWRRGVGFAGPASPMAVG